MATRDLQLNSGMRCAKYMLLIVSFMFAVSTIWFWWKQILNRNLVLRVWNFPYFHLGPSTPFCYLDCGGSHSHSSLPCYLYLFNSFCLCMCVCVSDRKWVYVCEVHSHTLIIHNCCSAVFNIRSCFPMVFCLRGPLNKMEPPFSPTKVKGQ